MKKTSLAIGIVALMCIVSNATAQMSSQFQITSNGMMYKFDKSNPAAQSVHRGDVLVGELTLRFDGDTVYTNIGNPQRIIQVGDFSFPGDLTEGLLMMHKGDVACFGVSADDVAKYLKEEQMPTTYQKGQGMRFFYDIAITDILTPSDLAMEQELYISEMNQRKAEEPATIEKYLNKHNITATPNKDGVYVITNKQGKGKAIAKGKIVKANFVCRTLEGKLFDTSIESLAKDAGLAVGGRIFSPLTYTVGDLALIAGWDSGVEGLKKGSEVTLIIPSNMAYGAQGAGKAIPPYTPIVIDISILDVK